MYQAKALLEQQCMTFCAIMKAMEGHLTEHNILSTCDKVWQWTKVTLAAELDAMNGELQPPPNPPVELEPRQDGLESRKILVTNVDVKNGINRNKKPYTRFAMRVLWPEMAMAMRSGTPARIILRTAVRRKS